MYKNIVFDFGGVMVDFDPHKYLIDLFGNRGLEEEVYDLTFGSREWRLLDAGRITRGLLNTSAGGNKRYSERPLWCPDLTQKKRKIEGGWGTEQKCKMRNI